MAGRIYVMQYISHYQSVMGGMLLTADDIGLTGLWFEGQKYCAGCPKEKHLKGECQGEGNEEKEIPLFKEAKRWLDIYFSGNEPDFSVPLHFIGTGFQKDVWKILCTIPYGKTVTYGAVARQLAAQRGLERMSAQAVGGAVGHNKISIIVPCHRVIGADGSLTGYAGGLEKKKKLLDLEKSLSGKTDVRSSPQSSSFMQ